VGDGALASGLAFEQMGRFTTCSGGVAGIPLMNLGGMEIGFDGGGFGILVSEPGIRQWLDF